MNSLPYFISVDHLFNIETKDIIQLDYRDIFKNHSEQNLFVKHSVDRSHLNDQFRDELETMFGFEISKINLWYWGASDSRIAHIDCGPSLKERHPFAINFVLNSEESSVAWYDVSEENLTIKTGDEGVPGLDIQNVTTYIPVDVTGLTPSKIWSSKDLTVINTSIPHIIDTKDFRISVSIQFPIQLTLEAALSALQQHKNLQL